MKVIAVILCALAGVSIFNDSEVEAQVAEIYPTAAYDRCMESFSDAGVAPMCDIYKTGQE